MSNITDKIRIERAERLMPGGVPRYIRVWEHPTSAEQYCIVFTKKTLDRGVFMSLGLSAQPFHPWGICQHSETRFPNGSKEWGKRIKFEDLSADCQRLVIDDYKYIWDL